MAVNLETRALVLAWIAEERSAYADHKYADGTDRRDPLVEAMREGDWTRWLDFAGNYLKRAELFGFDTPAGRQALAKSVVTLLHTLETAVDLFGPMPAPGQTSGDLAEWVGVPSGHGDS